MSEKRWWALRAEVGGEIFAVKEKQCLFTSFDFLLAGRNEIEEVEIRPLHQCPCVWELSRAPDATYTDGGRVPDGTNLDRLRRGWCKYCPACGRRLGEP